MEIVDGPNQGLKREFAGPEVRIGTSKESDLVLADRTASRHHLLVRVEGQRIRVTDAGSLNGTFLDGIQIVDAYARPDSIFAARDRAMEKFDRRYLGEALRRSGGNVSRAAEMIGVSRKFMHRAIAKYKLRGD